MLLTILINLGAVSIALQINRLSPKDAEATASDEVYSGEIQEA